ncbi:MAG: chromosome segregation protein SMC [Desulfobacterales bacterium]|jgi:chromosome segregation protein
MKLKKLEILGFKSFPDKAAIHFPPGISAVVGPNGCGKSNIIDALRWVMGEQSVKTLRGKAMEDIIFSGSSGKPPLNMAEVALTLVNDNGSMPVELRDYAEIMITRRLYRSGESAYFLNKRPCRLKDIRNLFLGSGLGSKSFAVIQQGNIGAITDAGPDERRHFIEEAAGVTRFKQRRVETVRKIEATRRNLYRVMDIVGEIKRQMASLKRQARKAELFKNYQERSRTFDLLIGLHYYDQYATELTQSTTRLQELKDADLNHVSEIRKLDAAVEDIKLQRHQKNQEIANQKSRQFELQRSLDKTENDLQHTRGDIKRLDEEVVALENACQDLEAKNARMVSEIAESETQQKELEQAVQAVRQEIEQERSASREVNEKMEVLKAALEEHRSRLTDLVGQEARYRNIHQAAQNNRESLQRRLKKTDEEAALAVRALTNARSAETRAQGRLAEKQEALRVIARQIGDVREQLEARGRKLAEQIKQGQALELELNKHRSRYTTLKKMEDNYEWYRDGVRAIMQRHSPQERSREGIRGLVADVITPEPGYEVAVEAALGESLQYVLVDGQRHAHGAIDYLHEQASGRSGFVPLDTFRPLAKAADELSLPQSCLLNHVRVEDAYRPIAHALFGHVAVVDDLAEATSRFNRNGVLQTIVTRKGEVVTCQGAFVGGGGDGSAGILAQKKEIRELASQIKTLENRITGAREIQSALTSEVKTLETDLQVLLTEKHQIVQDEIEAQKKCYRATEDLNAAVRHQEIVQLEQDRLQGEESDIGQEIDQVSGVLNDIAGHIETTQNQVAATSTALESVTHQMEVFQQKEMDVRLRLTALQAKMENNANSLRRLKEFQSDGTQRSEELNREIQSKRERGQDARRRIQKFEEVLALHYGELEQLTRILGINEENYQAIDRQLQESDQTIAQLQSRRERNNEKLRLLEVDVSQRRMKREHIVSRLNERYQGGVDAFRRELQAKMNADFNPTIEEAEQELERCRQKLAQIHDVNMGAIKEYEQYKTRYDFLCKQQDDLNQAIEDLQTVIRKINTFTQERFLTTLAQVNEKLDEVFPKLFEGGAAHLVLANPKDPLESGVEFMIQPPGKKVTRMSLLSGGEKALAAIAFIFSIFLIKPTAFCLLDEIDAPLDEANVYRFNDLLKIIGAKSQIIMITHNKKSMEFADTLFGITMENKGISKVVSVNLERDAA